MAPEKAETKHIHRRSSLPYLKAQNVAVRWHADWTVPSRVNVAHPNAYEMHSLRIFVPFLLFWGFAQSKVLWKGEFCAPFFNPCRSRFGRHSACACRLQGSQEAARFLLSPQPRDRLRRHRDKSALCHARVLLRTAFRSSYTRERARRPVTHPLVPRSDHLGQVPDSHFAG